MSSNNTIVLPIKYLVPGNNVLDVPSSFDDAIVEYKPGFIENDNAQITWNSLIDECGQYFDTKLDIPRHAFYICSDKHYATYSYGKARHESRDIWPPTLIRLRDLIESYTGVIYNAAVVNLYRNGLDSVGWHSDDEPGVHSTIASMSFGATRKFQMRSIGVNRSEIREVNLRHGCLLIMKGTCQRTWQHRVPRDYSSKPRLNITFRYMGDIYPNQVIKNPPLILTKNSSRIITTRSGRRRRGTTFSVPGCPRVPSDPELNQFPIPFATSNISNVNQSPESEMVSNDSTMTSLHSFPSVLPTSRSSGRGRGRTRPLR